jgi:hypothetical protein
MYSQLRFKKFKPTVHLGRHVSEVFLHLIEFIPLGAGISAHFTKVKGKYQCSLAVESSEGLFTHQTVATDPISALDVVTQKIKIKIESWQRRHMALNEPSFWEFKEVINE